LNKDAAGSDSGGDFLSERRFLALRLSDSKTRRTTNHASLSDREIEITNAKGLESYRDAVPATIAQYCGRFVTRGRAAEVLEGAPEPKRIVVLEFADVAALKRW
jgi:uncharacterized protein DUF1330